ncbi:MAG: PD40 domain-containing protein [Chloroflexi bacterium]|nr:PD40 domain-containing protein [Chloroflexota bacterium]
MTRLHLFLLGCVCLLLVVGCGGKGEPVTAVTPMPSTPATETAVPPTPTQPLATDTPVGMETAVLPTNTATVSPTTATSTALSAGVLTETPTNTPVPLPPSPGEIVFLWSPEPKYDYGPLPQNLYFAKPGDVAGEWEMEAALTELHGAGLYLSPDSTKFAIRLFEDTNGDGIVSTRAENSNAYLYPLADKTLTRLTATEIRGAVRVGWLPDNKQFTYSLQKDIYLYNLEDSTSRQILSFPGLIYLHQWSPDGRWLAIVSSISDEPAPGGESHRLDLYNRETNTLISLVDKMGFSGVDWSPDSQWLVFNYDSNHGLFVTSVNELTPIELVSSGLSFASWSPDSQWLAFTTDIGAGNLNLWNPNTRSTETLFGGNGRMTQPIWSPHNNRLAIALNGEEESSLIVADAVLKTTSTILVGPKPGPPGPFRRPLKTLHWSPDGQWIMFEASGEDNQNLSMIDYSTGDLFTVLDFTEMTTPDNVYWLP